LLTALEGGGVEEEEEEVAFPGVVERTRCCCCCGRCCGSGVEIEAAGVEDNAGVETVGVMVVGAAVIDSGRRRVNNHGMRYF
jgi:hypothetical protein